MMPRLPLSAGIALGILASALLAGCGFGDLFRAPGPAAGIVFVFQSDTNVVAGDTIPLVIAVLVDGEALANPRLVVASTDTTRLRLTPSSDGLIGVRVGPAGLAVRLVGSMITGPAPDTIQSIRVRP